MSSLTFDQDLCIQCGACVDVCPTRIIIRRDQAVPSVHPRAERACIVCGHCVAVCPKSAVAHKDMLPGDCMPLEKALDPSGGQIRQFLLSRRSIRSYQEKEVPREVIYEVIALASHAPSGHNLQPVHWKVIHDRKNLSKLESLVLDWMKEMVAKGHPLAQALSMPTILKISEMGNDMIFRGAPHLVAAHAAGEERMTVLMGTIALTYFELALRAKDLGGCWAGFFDIACGLSPAITEALELPEGHRPCGSMFFGYPKHRYMRVPKRKEPRITWA
ncbi:MAG: nitroreductase family protein [Candidatus Eremiobacteraeota bacterium]|nr:nitroreductase family protein [Candidatus Eremiobacteraeota bacterium]